MTKKTLAKRIISLRKNGCTYSEIGRATGVADSTIWKVLKENGMVGTEKTGASDPSPVEAASESLNTTDSTVDFAEHLYSLVTALDEADNKNKKLTNSLENMTRELNSLKNKCSSLEKEAVKTRQNQRNIIEKLRTDNETLMKESAESKSRYETQLRELRDKTTEIPQEFVTEFDQMSAENRDLKAKLEAMTLSIKKISAGQKTSGQLLSYGFEQDFFDGEIKEYVLEALDEYIRMHDDKKRQRRIDVLQDVLDNNHFQHIHEMRREAFSNALNKTNGSFTKASTDLDKLGLTKISSNAHEKWVYFNDPRYTTAVSQTPSDHRMVKNTISDVVKEMF